MGFVLTAIVAAAVSLAIGMVWYGRFFGASWMKLNKMKKKDVKPSPKLMVIAFIRHLLTAFVLVAIFSGDLMQLLQSDEFLFPVIITILPMLFLLWLGFTAMPALGDILWTKKPIKLYIINVGYELVSVIAMAFIITVML